jgi:hypothetical protein
MVGAVRLAPRPMGLPPHYNPDDDPESKTYTGWGKGPRVRLLRILVLAAIVLYVLSFTQPRRRGNPVEAVILAILFFGWIYSMFVADELDRSASSVAAGGWLRWKRALRAARPRFARASLYIVGGIAGVALAIWFFGTPG